MVDSEIHERPEGIEGGVVVGVDDSDPSRLALAFAAEEARLRGCVLHVIRAWGLSNAPRPASWRPGYVPSFAEYQEATEQWLAGEVARVGADREGLDVRLHVVHAPAASTLVDASHTADILVVGSRGRGGFAGLLLGSTSDQVVRHGWCPVVVVRDMRRHR